MKFMHPVEHKSNLIADMHTHTEYSNDSEGKFEDLVKSQIDKGTLIFAVTDHFNTAVYKNRDMFAEIKNCCDEADVLQKKYGDKCLILKGVEIDEGFWYPEAYEKIMSIADYDVVLSSIHMIKFKNDATYYSKIDFSAFTYDELYEFMDIYYDDVLKMFETLDFDILTHLNCPSRYINGKYNMNFDCVGPYAEKIEKILKKTIENGIALEVNTSSFDMLDDFMPGMDIIKKYYQMGGKLITLASDAHVHKNASLHFDKAIAFLKETGFENIYYYKNRKAIPIKI